jgi:hypothetical protein
MEQFGANGNDYFASNTAARGKFSFAKALTSRIIVH